MCGRYFVDRAESPKDLERIIDALNRKGQIVKTGEVFPNSNVGGLRQHKVAVTSSLREGLGIHATLMPEILFYACIYVREIVIYVRSCTLPNIMSGIPKRTYVISRQKE